MQILYKNRQRRISMAKTFGQFIRSKRKQRMLKLNTFAKQIGISNVYLSYIETDKRPAPSHPVLQRMSVELQLSPDEESYMYSLAELSRRRVDFSDDVWGYVASRPYVYETLRLAAKNDVTKEQWSAISRIIEIKKEYKDE